MARFALWGGPGHSILDGDAATWRPTTRTSWGNH